MTVAHTSEVGHCNMVRKCCGRCCAVAGNNLWAQNFSDWWESANNRGKCALPRTATAVQFYGSRVPRPANAALYLWLPLKEGMALTDRRSRIFPRIFMLHGGNSYFIFSWVKPAYDNHKWPEHFACIYLVDICCWISTRYIHAADIYEVYTRKYLLLDAF
jgi:hypothetical protein